MSRRTHNLHIVDGNAPIPFANHVQYRSKSVISVRFFFVQKCVQTLVGILSIAILLRFDRLCGQTDADKVFQSAPCQKALIAAATGGVHSSIEKDKTTVTSTTSSASGSSNSSSSSSTSSSKGTTATKGAPASDHSQKSTKRSEITKDHQSKSTENLPSSGSTNSIIKRHPELNENVVANSSQPAHSEKRQKRVKRNAATKKNIVVPLNSDLNHTEGGKKVVGKHVDIPTNGPTNMATKTTTTPKAKKDHAIKSTTAGLTEAEKKFAVHTVSCMEIFMADKLGAGRDSIAPLTSSYYLTIFLVCADVVFLFFNMACVFSTFGRSSFKTDLLRNAIHVILWGITGIYLYCQKIHWEAHWQNTNYMPIYPVQWTTVTVISICMVIVYIAEIALYPIMYSTISLKSTYGNYEVVKATANERPLPLVNHSKLHAYGPTGTSSTTSSSERNNTNLI